MSATTAPTRSSALVGPVLVMTGAAMFGTVGTARALGPDAPALPVAFARLGLAALVLAAYALLVSRGAGTARRAALGSRAVWGAAAGQAAFQLCFLTAVTRVGVATGTLIAIGATPMLAGLLTRNVSRAWAAATAVGVAGLVLLVGGGDVRDAAGVAIALGASLSYAVYIITGRLIAASGIDLDVALAVIFGLAAVMLAPALITGPWQWLGSWQGVALVSWLALVPTVLAYHCFNRGLRNTAAAPAATLGLTEPVVATVLGLLVLGERLTAAAAVGAVLVLGAVLLLALATASDRPGAGR